MKYIKWTDEQIEYLKKNYNKTNKELSVILGHPLSSVKAKINKELKLVKSSNNHPRGENNPNWKGGLKIVNCSVCGKEIKRMLCETKKSKYHICSNKCKKIALKTTGKEKHKNFKGKFKSSDGYILVRDYNHPNSDGYGYVREHRLIMEKRLGRLLNKSEVVHHANGNREDNRIENLRLFRNQREHIEYHVKFNKLFSNKGVFGK